VALRLAKQFDLPYIEGDDVCLPILSHPLSPLPAVSPLTKPAAQFHPQSNVDKMANGIPLTDDDRWDWLETIRKQAVGELENGASGCVVTCSCLKRKYRDVIRLAGRDADDVVMRFVYLRADKELLLARVRARKDHFMKDDMVASQFEALEEPDETETDVIPIDVNRTLDSVLNAAMGQVARVLNEHV